jgi:glycosyltransferase involved in cell wall biosynthesis
MGIIIFGDLFTFPEGNAATNRVYTYAKGFLEQGIKPYILCFGNEYKEESGGSINGVQFYHPLDQKKRNRYFIIRRWHKFKKFFRTLLILKEINKKDKITAIICYTNLLQTQSYGFLLSRTFKAKMVLEISEHPLRNYQGFFLRRLLGKLRILLETRLCDGIICISRYLIDFYLKKGVSSTRLFLVPSTVDSERFRTSESPILNFEYIVYCGNLNLSKDGVDILIKSFAKISEKFPKINLVLIGTGKAVEESLLTNIASMLNIQERLYFLGQITRTDVPNYLKNAKVLALSRPSSIIADAGFPSKLTEYLAVGKPVVVTKVGEIPNYLEDGKNAFLSPPGSVEAFSEKLDFVLSNYEFAKKVALKGQQLTLTVFNYNFQAGKIIAFINTLKL